MNKKRILITGGAGRIGSAIRTYLSDRYVFRVLDLVPPANLSADDDYIIGDASDFGTMVAAAEGVEAIMHLALMLTGKDQITHVQRAQNTLKTDIPAVWCVLEAARINGVKLVIYASSNHATGLYEEDGMVSSPDLAFRPDSVYGAGKAFGEALGRYYADRKGIRVHCLRIANFNGKDEPGRSYEPGHSRWLSPRDLGQMVRKCIDASHIQFGVFYGVSSGAEKRFDITNARELLGYEPQDDGSAEQWRKKYEKPSK